MVDVFETIPETYVYDHDNTDYMNDLRILLKTVRRLYDIPNGVRGSGSLNEKRLGVKIIGIFTHDVDTRVTCLIRR